MPIDRKASETDLDNNRVTSRALQRRPGGKPHDHRRTVPQIAPAMRRVMVNSPTDLLERNATKCEFCNISWTEDDCHETKGHDYPNRCGSHDSGHVERVRMEQKLHLLGSGAG